MLNNKGNNLIKLICYSTCLMFFLIPFYSCDFTKNSDDTARIKTVIDGDTVVLDDPEETLLRYLGINAPENYSNESPGDPFSRESTLLNSKLLDEGSIRIEFDKEMFDQYGRILGYVFVGELLVNEEIIRQGLARVFFIGPNRKYEERFHKAQMEAKKFKRGIWSNHKKYKKNKGNDEFIVKTYDVDRHLGQRVVVRGKINDFSENRKVVLLEMDDGLDLVIFRDALENFKFFGIVPEKYYVGKKVEAVGRVKMYRGNPQIAVSHPISLRVLE